MKNTKKIITTLLLVTILATSIFSLTACGVKKPEQKTELPTNTWYYLKDIPADNIKDTILIITTDFSRTEGEVHFGLIESNVTPLYNGESFTGAIKRLQLNLTRQYKVKLTISVPSDFTLPLDDGALVMETNKNYDLEFTSSKNETLTAEYGVNIYSYTNNIMTLKKEDWVWKADGTGEKARQYSQILLEMKVGNLQVMFL